MKTNLLAQNDDLVISNLKADVGKSVMDLSHSVTFPIDVDGAILPICCIETVPSDSFEISVEVLLRQLTPLKVPLMTNLRLNTAFYYCDNRLAWKKWERFMTGGRSGNEIYDIPRVANVILSKTLNPNKYDLVDTSSVTGTNRFKNINYRTSLHTYFGVSLNHSYDSADYDSLIDYSSELPIAFPFFDYQMICRDYYTNVDRLPESPSTDYNLFDFDNLNSDWSYKNLFPSDDDEIRLIDGPQLSSGFDTGDDSDNTRKGFMLDKVRYHNVREDYFTSSKKAPMRGTPPALNAESTITLQDGSTFNLKNISLVNTGDSNVKDLFVKETAGELSNYIPTSVTADTNNVISTSVPHPNNASPVTRVDSLDFTSLESTTDGDLQLHASIAANWTAADIRLLGQLSVWQELNMLHEPYYDDFLNAHFDNVRVGESALEKPQYIGGTSQIISINEIMQTSASSGSSPLGNQGATAMSLAQNFVGRYYANNYGYIIGVCYLLPDLLYKPAMPRHFSRRTKEDYYSPEFANLSMQATLNKEIFFSNDVDWNNAPWGYTGAFDELRSIPNRIAGDLLNSSFATDLGHWVLTRYMANDNLPAMESTWLSLKNNVDTTAWQVQTVDNQPFPKFMLQAANYIKAVRPMPKVAIPKAL